MKHHTMLLLAGASALALGAAPTAAMQPRTGGLTAAAPAPVAASVVRPLAAIAEGRGPSRNWKANPAPVNEAAVEVASVAASTRPAASHPAAAFAPTRALLPAVLEDRDGSAPAPAAVPPTALADDRSAAAPTPPAGDADVAAVTEAPAASDMTEATPGADAGPVPPETVPPAAATVRSTSLVALRSVYVSDPGAPWFMSWYDETLERTGPLFSPDIEIAANEDIVATLASAPAAAAVMPASEFAAYDTTGALVATPTGVRVCAAFVLSGSAPIDQLGDLHLLPQQLPVAVTPDTMSIASRVFEAYNVGDMVDLTEASTGAAMLGVGSGDLALAVTRVGDGEVIDFQGAGGVRVLELSEAMVAAGERFGLVEGRIGTDMVQGFVPQFRVRTLCDEIVVVAAGEAVYAPELLVRNGGGLAEIADIGGEGPADDDLWARTGDAIGQLQSILWGSEGAQ